MFLTNSMHAQKEQITKKKIRFYSCGPTVYGPIHIGNLRSALVSDLIVRTLRVSEFEVNYVRNFTNIDDKIIFRAKQENVSSEFIADQYTLQAKKDFALAQCLPPTQEPLVTDHIPEIIALIEKLIEKKTAYVSESKEVLFKISQFPEYGKLSHQNLEALLSSVRIQEREGKQSPLDFALWKPAKKNEPSWDSPWGKGRPGWHIECSAMAAKWLGDQIDIHHGGEDLIFPHHENEIAQSECATGKTPFSQIWVHHALVTVDGSKMSKSTGNIILACDFLTQYGAEITRYLLLGSHYRSVIDFSEKSLQNIIQALHRLYEAKNRLFSLSEKSVQSLLPLAESTHQKILLSLQDDLNTPMALSHLFVFAREINKTHDQAHHKKDHPEEDHTPESAFLLPHTLPAFLLPLLKPFDLLQETIGVAGSNPLEALKKLTFLQQKDTSLSSEEIESFMNQRKEARQKKDFAQSDAIRDLLLEKGILIEDKNGISTWKIKAP
jgi:cysteinyl-tRNA synthetase